MTSNPQLIDVKIGRDTRMNAQRARQLLQRWLAEDGPDDQSETLRVLLDEWDAEDHMTINDCQIKAARTIIDDAIAAHLDDAIAVGQRARRLRDIITARFRAHEDTETVTSGHRRCSYTA